MVKPCWRPSTVGDGRTRQRGSSGGKVDGLMWYKDLGQHSSGDFSMAVVQANSLLEDQSQIESGSLCINSPSPFGTFVGIYDGHGGPEAARFVNSNLFRNIKKFTSENREVSGNVIKKAFSTTEEDFLALVKKQWQEKPQIASVGSCCLVGIVSNGLLYVGNAGDSTAVLGRLERSAKKITPVQLSTEHNASMEPVRDELRSQHPGDPNIVVMKHGVWRVKGLIQVSRSIGDAYLKKAEFNREPLLPKFRLPEPFDKPILSSEPSIHVHRLQPEDQFVVFASDGLWEHLSHQEVVDIVDNYPRNVRSSVSHANNSVLCSLSRASDLASNVRFLVIPEQGIAKRLVKAALKVAAKKREMRYSDLKKIDRGVRRHFHDDITVVVLFLDLQSSNRTSPLSIKGPR